jgi:hypothetical protein
MEPGKSANKKALLIKGLIIFYGGESGIRTHGGL